MKQLLVLLLLLCSMYISAQDVIVKKDGSTILAKVLEITSEEVKYKKFSNLDGPSYVIRKIDILSVNYENGEKEELGNIETSIASTEIVKLKAGTEIPVQIVSPVKAADVKVGQTVSFKVSRDVSVDGVTVIPYGTPVKGVVYTAKKSSWWGTKGKLGIRIDGIELPNGGKVPLSNGNVFVTGTNRTALSVVLFLFVTIPACAICGSKAQIPVGYEVLANVANEVFFDSKGRFMELAPSSIAPINHSYPCKAMIVRIDGKNIDAIIISEDNEIVTYIDKRRSGSMKGLKSKLHRSQIKEIQYQ